MTQLIYKYRDDEKSAWKVKWCFVTCIEDFINDNLLGKEYQILSATYIESAKSN